MNNIKVNKINQISQETKQKLLRKTAFSLPDNPAARGMKPNEIKKYLYCAIVDFDSNYIEKDPSIISIIEELIDNINNSTEESSNNLNTVFQEIENRINTITREIETQKEVNVAFDNRIIRVEGKRHWHDNKAFLDTLTEDKIQSITGLKKYIKYFTKETLSQIISTDKYSIFIPYTEHLLKNPYVEQIIQSTDEYETPIICDVQVDKNGSIKIYVTVDVNNFDNYNGKIIIKGE